PEPSLTPRSVPRSDSVAGEQATTPSAGQPATISPEPSTCCMRIALPPGAASPWNATSTPPAPSGMGAAGEPGDGVGATGVPDGPLQAAWAPGAATASTSNASIVPRGRDAGSADDQDLGMSRSRVGAQREEVDPRAKQLRPRERELRSSRCRRQL